jgi:hypothetical protein
MPDPRRRGNGRLPRSKLPPFNSSPHRPASIRTFFEACIGCVPVGVRKSDGCCHLTADLATAPFRRSAGPRATRSHPNSASLPKLHLHFMPLLRRGLCGHARVRILPRLPIACAAAQPVSVRPPPRPVSSRSYHRAASAKPHRRRSLSGPNGPKMRCEHWTSSFRTYASPSLVIRNCGRLSPDSLRRGRSPK